MNQNVVFFLKFKKDLQFYYSSLSLLDALNAMKKHGFTAVPVIDQAGCYMGSVTEGDFLWFILQNGNDPALLENTQVKQLIREGFMPAVNIDVSLEELLETSFHQNYVPVVDDRNKFIGIVTRQSLLRHFGNSSPKLVTTSSKSLDAMSRQSLNG